MTIMDQAVPSRTLDQRMRALDKGNAIRKRRAELKQDVRAGRRFVVDVLADPPEWVGSMQVAALLRAAPKYGRVKVNKLLVRCRISPSRTIGALSVRQRDELVAGLS